MEDSQSMHISNMNDNPDESFETAQSLEPDIPPLPDPSHSRIHHVGSGLPDSRLLPSDPCWQNAPTTVSTHDQHARPSVTPMPELSSNTPIACAIQFDHPGLDHLSQSTRFTTYGIEQNCSDASIHVSPNLTPQFNEIEQTKEYPDSLSERRGRRRCMNCRLDKGNRGCHGYPLCDRCCRCCLPSLGDINLLNGSFVDWKKSAFICEDYWRRFGEFLDHVAQLNWAAFETGHVSNPRNCTKRADSASTIILDFYFIDRLKLGYSNHHTVIVGPRQADPLKSGIPSKGPSIDLNQMDESVRAEVWGLTLWNSLDGRLRAQEQALWSTVKLFLGYLSLKLNLGTMYLRLHDSTTIGMRRGIAAEMVYALDFRLHILHVEMCVLCNEIYQTPEFAQDPSMVLYALEVLYRVMSSMHVRDRPDFQQDKGLADQINQMLGLILKFECLVSRPLQTQHSTNKLPAILDFARSPGTMTFPRFCVVSAHQHSSVLKCPMSSPWDSTGKVRVLDILEEPQRRAIGWYEGGDGMQIENGDGSKVTVLPEQFIDDSNKIHELKDIELSLDQHQETGQDGQRGSISAQCSRPSDSNLETPVPPLTFSPFSIWSPQTSDLSLATSTVQDLHYQLPME